MRFLTLVFVSIASAQPSFEVASIKPAPFPLQKLHQLSVSGSRVSLEAYSIRELIQEAYELEYFQIAPDLPPKTYYNILANAPGDSRPTRDDYHRMLQSLLVERFALRTHWDRREIPVYSLVVGKHSPKLKESAPDSKSGAHITRFDHSQRIVAKRLTMPELARDLRNVFGDVGRPVVDRTGLTGEYEVTLVARLGSGDASNPQSDDLSIFTALEEQLGLRLQPDKTQFDVLIVDHIEAPTSN